MKAVVVYESLWGNTAAVARAIAEGLGPGAIALSTAEASAEAVAGVDLIIAGAPVLGFRLPTDAIRAQIERDRKSPTPPDLTQPTMRSWLAGLPPDGVQGGCSAAFETRIWWSPGGSTGAIERGLARAGYRQLAKSRKFIVEGSYGPLRGGELERARAWGAELAALLG
jgi:hypothetical protein